ncbi:hypothetical protein GCM10018781_51760 [Kitasatospora indigofera]|uniref:Uncharacterized protein n=1 Tax=Kitasatospora indigofera TaxID=67307 RepID=A0A919KZT0_9ACTN|nr:hypothetical protein [Kitasatospora indigofera]GHH77726.1 hypothetical protein GCM10018781_51760 [Kitasatospora indigofera]
MADEVADDRRGPGAGQRDDVEPVAPDAGRRIGGQVPAGRLDGGPGGRPVLQQAPLRAERGVRGLVGGGGFDVPPAVAPGVGRRAAAWLDLHATPRLVTDHAALLEMNAADLSAVTGVALPEAPPPPGPTAVDAAAMLREAATPPRRAAAAGDGGTFRVPGQRIPPVRGNRLAQWSRIVDHYSHAYR